MVHMFAWPTSQIYDDIIVLKQSLQCNGARQGSEPRLDIIMQANVFSATENRDRTYI